jgi:hypothetical protein
VDDDLDVVLRLRGPGVLLVPARVRAGAIRQNDGRHGEGRDHSHSSD